MKLTAKQMRSLYDFFKDIDDIRRAEGKKHQLATILSLAAAAILCGMRGYKIFPSGHSHLATKPVSVSDVVNGMVNMKYPAER